MVTGGGGGQWSQVVVVDNGVTKLVVKVGKYKSF